jgi:N-methylhydantoinase A
MKYKIGIDIGGTFTDLIAIDGKGNALVHKILSTPHDPSEGFVQGLRELAQMAQMSFPDFLAQVDGIVHGTTVATNALLTLRGAKTALITTQGFRDALEMRRGVREERYNNRYVNVPPLAPRHLRFTVDERTESNGNVIKALDVADLEPIVAAIRKQKVEAVAICFMHAYRNADNERKAVEYLRAQWPEGHADTPFITASHEVLPSIRFYERVSTTVVNAFVGPIVSRYFHKLLEQLREIAYHGPLLVMQSNGGVVSPDVVTKIPAVTVLSGPAAAPTAGAWYAQRMGWANCITVDMGGTSFDAALVVDNQCITSTDGSINRYRVALPSLDIVTIGAGGGSIGWINQGGLLQMGPQSAGAMPGPVCYGRGGLLPTCTDADVVLGYLNPGFFAGGHMNLDKVKATKAIDQNLGQPLGLDTVQTAAGMYRIINSNMAQGVRQISIERGYDPREFLFIVAGGAGAIHAGEICRELEIPMFLVPNVSSIFCAAGMLLGDLKHNYIRSFYTSFSHLDKNRFLELFMEMEARGLAQLAAEGVPVSQVERRPVLDMRYQGQYHEVQLDCDWHDIVNLHLTAIFDAFHTEHNRQFGYSLREENTEMELINLRLQVVGMVEKPKFTLSGSAALSATEALKEWREIYLPGSARMQQVPIYDGDLNICGATLHGPCIVEKVTTSILVPETHDCQVDNLGSFIVYQKGMESALGLVELGAIHATTE